MSKIQINYRNEKGQEVTADFETPFPVRALVAPNLDEPAEDVDQHNPLPVYVPSGFTATTVGKLYYVQPFRVPGIAAADAFDANDAFGTMFAIPVPRAGAIVAANYHDLDDEQKSKEMWLLRADFTAAASDAAFSLSDDDNALVVAVLSFTVDRDAVNNRFYAASSLPIWYVAPLGYLFCQFKTLDVDNIAALNMPSVSLIIEPYELA